MPLLHIAGYELYLVVVRLLPVPLVICLLSHASTWTRLEEQHVCLLSGKLPENYGNYVPKSLML